MRFTLAVVLALGLSAEAFVPRHFTLVHHPSLLRMSMVQETDVSVPYDAAARLAYDEWRAKFGKGAFDDKRYATFKANYEMITVANVSAKKEARDKGEPVGALMTLNEYGDCTEEEYKAAMQSTSTSDLLEKAVEAAESQSEASSALQDAADALAEEEEVRGSW